MRAFLASILLFSSLSSTADHRVECLRDLKDHAHAYQLNLDPLTEKCKAWMNKESKKTKLGAMRMCDAGPLGGVDKPYLENISTIKAERIESCQRFCQDVDLGNPKICHGDLGLQTWIHLVEAL